MSLTILVADDDLGIRVAIADYLELSGYIVITAADGQEALTTLTQSVPHLLIADISMPRMNGHELVQQVRRQPMFRLLPVIFLTERTDIHDRIRGYEVGCDVYLPKPFELKELGVVVRSLLERSQLIESEWRTRIQMLAQPITQPVTQPVTQPITQSINQRPPVQPVTQPSHPQLSPPTSLPPTTTTTSSHSAEIPSPQASASSPLQAAPQSHFSGDRPGQQQQKHLPPTVSFSLTSREQDVLTFLAQGFSNSRIGEELHLSPRTIEKYVSRLLQKTETCNRSELLRFAMDHHLVDA